MNHTDNGVCHLILPVVCHAALSIITTAYLSFSVALDIVDKCCDAWNDILKKDNFVKKLCSREWIELV
jgi:hypothetical protein